MHISHFHLPANNRMSVVADGFSTGSFYRVQPDQEPGHPVAVAASATQYTGPWPTDRDYVIVSNRGALVASLVLEGNESNPDAYLQGGSVTGSVGNLNVVPAGVEITLDTGGQATVYTKLTVNGMYHVKGHLRAGTTWVTT